MAHIGVNAEKFGKAEKNKEKLGYGLRTFILCMVLLSAALTVIGGVAIVVYYLIEFNKLSDLIESTPVVDRIMWVSGTMAGTAGWISIVAVYVKESRDLLDEIKAFVLGAISEEEITLIIGLSDRAFRLAETILLEEQEDSGAAQENRTRGTASSGRQPDKRKRVLIIEKLANNPKIPEVRRKGALVICGDANDYAVLKKAQFHKAKYIIILTGSDLTNIEISAQLINISRNIENLKLANQSGKSRAEKIPAIDYKQWHIVCHIDDYSERRALGSLYDKGLHIRPIQLISTNHLSAKKAVQTLNLPDLNVQRGLRDKPATICIIGDADFMVDLYVQLALVGASLCSGERPGGYSIQKLKVLHLTENNQVANLKNSLSERFPEYKQFLEVTFETRSILPARGYEALLPKCDKILICVKNDLTSYEIGLSIQRHLRRLAAAGDEMNCAEIINVYRKEPQFKYLEDLYVGSQPGENSEPGKTTGENPILVSTCGYTDFAAECLDETRESRAKRIHDEFFSKLNPRLPDRPSHNPWDQLNDFCKESNRSAADFIPHLNAMAEMAHHEDSMSLAGFNVDLIDSDPVQRDRFQDQPLDWLGHCLSQAEHDRWSAFHFSQGWVAGEKRDDAKKIHDCLVSYEQLDGELKPQRVKDFKNVLSALFKTPVNP